MVTNNFPKKKLTRLQKEVLIGILLGDGSLQLNTTKKKCRLRFTQKDKAYIGHIYNIFHEFAGTPPKKLNSTGIYYFNTLQFCLFHFYYRQFYYLDGRKKIPRHINWWLTPRVIAYWFMDDGSAKDQKNSSGIRFCSESFSNADVIFLAKKLGEVCHTKTSTFRQRNSLRIYVSGKGQNGMIFGKQILPYIFKSKLVKCPQKWFH